MQEMSTNSTNHRGHGRPQEKRIPLKPHPQCTDGTVATRRLLYAVYPMSSKTDHYHVDGVHVEDVRPNVSGVKTLQLMHTQGIGIEGVPTDLKIQRLLKSGFKL